MHASPELRLVACPNPFTMERVDVVLPAGGTVAEILEAAGARPGLHAHVFVGDALIPRERWRWVRPKPGAVLTVRVVPMGGGGGGKNPLRTVLTIALMVVAPELGVSLGTALGIDTSATLFGSFTVGKLLGAGISLIGGLAINALAPPPKPRLGSIPSSLGAREPPAYAITGARNQATLFGPVPRVYGVHKLYPPYAAQPYTEVLGGEQVLNLLFDCGYGPLKFSDFRIGETPLANFSGVEMEVRPGESTDPPITLYRNQVDSQALSVTIRNADGPRIFESANDAQEIILDFAFQGLVSFSDQGNRESRSVTVKAEIRAAGSNDPWSTTGVLVSGTSTSTAATLQSSTASTETWRTDAKTAGQLSVKLGLLAAQDGDDAQFPSRSSNEQYRLSTRRVGESAWTQQQVLPARQASTAGPYPAPPEQGSATTANLVVPVDEQIEVLVEVVNPDGSAASVAPDVQELRYATIASTGQETFSAASASLVFKTLRIKTPSKGRYEVRVTRLTADSSSAQVRDTMVLTTLKTVTYAAPVTASGHALIALRIKATEQLNGIIDQVNVVAQALLPTWDGSAWTAPVETRSPAWAYADVLRGAANARPIADSKIDAAALLAWANDCAAAGRELNAVVDFRSTVFELLRDIAAVGRAAFTVRDGLYSIVQDKAQSVVVQHFTPRNSRGFRGTKAFVDRPHALKVRFINEAKGWQRDERIVYDDGYDETSATRFEVLELWGVTEEGQAWREGRYHIATARLRPEVYELEVDVEHIVCTRGDLVRVAHDVPLFGIGWARIKSVTLDGSGNATDVTLDDVVAMSDGKSYSARIRRSDGTTVVAGVVTVAGEQSSLTFSPAISAASAPAAGDLLLFGETGQETVELIVKAIEPRSDLSAKLILVDAAPAVHSAESGTIPAFDSQITLPPEVAAELPPTPVIEGVQSDESVLELAGDGSYTPVIVVSVSLPDGATVPASAIQARYRLAGSGDPWTRLPDVPPETTAITVRGVTSGQRYDIQVRTVASPGRASDWAEVLGHQVVGADTAPPDITELRLEGTVLRWPYPSPPRDFAGFRVRHRAGTTRQWSGSLDAHDDLIKGTAFDISGIPGGGPRVLMVVGEDVAGNRSANPAYLTVHLGDPIRDNLVLTHDLDALGYPGTITNGSVSGGDVVASDDGGLYLQNGDDPYLPDGAALYLPVQFQGMTYTAPFVPEADATPSRMTIDATVVAEGFEILYRGGASSLYLPDASEPYLPVGSDPYLGETPGAFAPWPGELHVTRQPYEIQIKTAAGATQGRISALALKLDVEDVVEQLEDVAIGATGSRLPITKSYRQIVNVGLTLQDDGGAAASLKTVDKDATRGPLVRAYDKAGVLTTATIDATVQGY